MQRIAGAYVPFWVYRVRYETVGAVSTRIFALDAVHGTLDLYEFPQIPGEEETLALETRNRLMPRLEPDAAEELLRMKVLRVLSSNRAFSKPARFKSGH